MELLIKLLERKNKCFRQMLDVTSALIGHLEQGELDRLPNLKEQRASLIRVVEKIEIDMKSEVNNLMNKKISLAQIIEASSPWTLKKDEMITAILALDKRIMNQIEKARNETSQKLASLHVNLKTVAAYKSPQAQIERAESFSHLDKKA